MGVPRKFSQSEIGPAVDVPWASAIEAIVAAGQTIVANDIVIVNGRSSSLMQVRQADADAVLTSRGMLYVAVTAGAAGTRITIVPWRLIASANTGGSTVGNPVFLSDTAGAWSLTAGTVAVQIGEVLVVSATVGVVQLHPSATFGGPAAMLTGTEQLTFTINDDAAAATDEDPALILLGGDGVAAPNDDLVRSRIMQDSTAEQAWYQIERSRNAGAYARVSADFGIGRQGETTASLDASLHWNASTDAGAARRYNISHLGQEGTLALYYDQAGTATTPVVLIGRDGEVVASLDSILGMTAATDAAAARRASLTYLGQEHSLEWSSVTAALALSLIGTGGLGIKTAAADANHSASLSASQINLGAGGASVVDWVLARQAASVAEMASGDSLFSVGAASIGRRALAADANPTVALTATGLELGAGGASATDWVLTRQAAGVAEITTGDSLYGLGVGVLGVRNATADANPLIDIGSNGLRMGAGGASAVDWVLGRQAANVAEMGSGDSLFSVGAASIGRRNAGADANPTIALTATGLELGAGAASATDWVLARQAAGIAEITTGDSLFALGAGTLGVRNATGDANTLIDIGSAGLRMGAGGASATDVILARQAANVAEFASGDSLYVVAATVGVRALTGDANATASLSASQLNLGAGGATAVDVVLARQAANIAEFGSGDSMFIVGAASIGRRNASADANPTAAFTATGVELGAGAASATDWVLARQAANIAEMAGGDSFFSVGAASIGRRALTGDANATIVLTATGLELGAGGASVTDILLQRQAANVAELGSGDSLFSVGTATIGRRALSADANPTVALTENGLTLGAGGASVTDILLQRQAADTLELGTGDAIYFVGAGAMGRRNLSGDANPTIAMTASGLALGAGGASATDILLSRGAANRMDLAAGDTFQAQGFIETLDDVGSGTARRVGGAVFRISDTSASITSTAGADAETAFSNGTYTIPANMIKAGTVAKIRAMVRVSDGATAESLRCRLRLNGVGGTLLANTDDVDVATGAMAIFDVELSGHAAPGAASEVGWHGYATNFAANDAVVAARLSSGIANFATNGALDLVVTAQWTGANAGDDVELEAFEVVFIG